MGRSDKGLFVILLFIVVLTPQVFAETATELNVPNSPPVFSGLIPNFSWTEGPLENAFNMNDYFEDMQGDPMVFSVTGNDSIMVEIASDGAVSFFPPENYIGMQILTFYADDGYGNMPSNFVYLGIGVDTEPPKWYFPKRGKSKVYQNDILNFTANWTDNFELASYYLSIDQGNGWENVDYKTFTGVKNSSSNQVQISAPIGKIVEWKICASDASFNEGCTDVYSFAVVKKPTAPDGNSGDGDGGGEGGSGGDGTSTGGRITGENIKDLYKDTKDLVGKQTKEDYSLDIDSFLVELKQGESLTRVFEIVNTGTGDLSFDLSVTSLEKYTTLSTKNFTLEAGEVKTVTVEFNANLSAAPGQYFGSLVIKGIQDVVLPIVFTINPANLKFEVVTTVLPEYKNIKPGEEIFANINITNKGDSISSDVVLTYAIKDYYGNIYNSQEETFTLESVVVLEKNLVIPEDILLGKYIFYARVVNEKDIAIDSDDFLVGLNFRFEAFLKSSSIFLVVGLLSIISVILALRYKNQKKKERALNLYVKLTELKQMIKDNNFSKAANLYIAIKRIYGEPISRTILDDKQKLVDEIKRLAGKVDFEEEVPAEAEGGEEEGKEDREKDGEEKKEEKSEEKKKEKNAEESKPEKDDKEVKVEDKKEEKEDVKEKKEYKKEEVSEKKSEEIKEEPEEKKEEALSKEDDKKEEGKDDKKD